MLAQIITSTQTNAQQPPYLQALLLPHQVHRATLELHTRLQTRHGFVVLGQNLGRNSVVTRWNCTWQLNVLGELQVALFQRTLKIDVLDRFAEVGGLIDDGDQAVFHRVVDRGPFFDILGKDARGGDVEGFAAGVEVLVECGGEMDRMLERLTLLVGWE